MIVRTSFGESWFVATVTAAAVFAAPVSAEPVRGQVSIIIDDLGQQHGAGVRALNLPGPVALAFLPGATFTPVQAHAAHQRDKEVLLHLPLQPAGNAKAYPTALNASADHEAFSNYFRTSLNSVPWVSGVNNHQGSLLTEMPQQMNWLMEEFALRPGLYFVDSRTTAASVAYRTARAHDVPAAERSVFLDSVRGVEAVRRAFRQLVDKALTDERALAIGHPYPETLQVLEEELPKLAALGVRLVAPSELIARQGGFRGPYKPLRLTPSVTLATSTPGPGLPGATSVLAH